MDTSEYRTLSPLDARCVIRDTEHPLQAAQQPFAIAMKDNAMFAFAGLLEKWKDKTTGQVLRMYTILATDPNELMEPIHNRMPVIIPPKDYERRMAPADPSHLSLTCSGRILGRR